MWKQQKTSNLIHQLTLTVVITVILWDTALGLSDKRLCADENCKKVISLGRGTINYPAGEEGMVSFKINAKIRVKSKSAGSDLSLWGIEVNGREGFAPKRMIREEKILISEKDLTYMVDVIKPGEKVPILSQAPVQNSSEIVIETTKIEPKPDQSQAPLLNTSEIVVETTTTQPLETINKDEAIVSSPVESHGQPQNASPVQHDTIDVDGSKLPTLNESSSQKENIKQQKVSDVSSTTSQEHDADDDDDDNDIGDYDDDEEEEDEETEEIKEEATEKATPLRANVNTNGTKQVDPLTDNEDTSGIKASAQNTKHQKEGEETGENNQKDGAGTTLEEESTLGPNVKTNETKQLELHNNKVETSTENSNEEPLIEIGNITASISSTENSQDTLENKDIPEPTTVTPLVNKDIPEVTTVTPLENKDIPEADTATPLDNKLIEAKLDVQVLNESSEITKTTEKTATVEDLYRDDVNNNSFTESTNIIENVENSKASVESTTKADGAKEAFERAIIADEESATSAPNKTEEAAKLNEEISINATKNNEALPTANAEENVAEKHISKQSSLPDNNKINIDVVTQLPPIVNKVEIISNTEENSRVEVNSNEVTEEPPTHLPIETTTEVAGETDNVQVNTDQYSSSATDTNNTQTSSESAPSQPTSGQDSQHGIANTIEKQNEHSESQASTNLPFDSQNPADTQTQLPQTQLPQTQLPQTQLPQTQMPQTQMPQTQIPHSDQSPDNTNHYYTGAQYNPYDYDETSNTPLPPQYDNNNNNNNPNDLPQTTEIPLNDYYGQTPTVPKPTVDLEPEVTTQHPVHASAPENASPTNPPSFGLGSVEQVQPLATPTESPQKEVDPKSLPSQAPPVSVIELVRKETKGLFATIMDTVNNILPNNKKPKHAGYDQDDHHNQLDRILYSTKQTTQSKGEDDTLFCEKLDSNNCPHSSINTPLTGGGECECSFKTLVTTDFTLERFFQVLAAKILEISELIAFLAIVAATSLFFIFGYYCFCNSSSEGALLSKLNQLESCLLASHKENAILKHNLMSTRQKLASIEDNSFGSNDMVVSLKKELEEELLEKARLQEQIVTLQKELENAADAGIELNKIVSELLSNQTGDESIISSVEELQKQLNEQQNTILEINASLAEKSRENSELQLMIAEQNARYDTQISDLQQDNDELEAEKGNLQSRLEEIRLDFDKDITAALESKNYEIKRLQNEIVELSEKVENGHTKWQTSMAKVEALEECLRNVKRDPNVNINQVIDVANIRAELLDAQRKYNGVKERWEQELDARKLAETQLHTATAEVEKIKHDFNETEKDKLEAQTRLEVLSNYFKDKENQLQKELSLKETMWLKQQGETTTTVDRLTTMQEEIQSLKSQNDSLRAEIEAQVAAHKAQTGTLENRAHETWLAARQSDRRYEEARAEATALRRKLTVLAGGSVNEVNKPAAGPAGLGDDLANASSPIHMESPGSPMLGRMPPPPFLPPPFMGPPPPFMGMPPPPPFVPTTGEMRPAPLGRIMSPPPPQRSSHMDYEDYLDYEGNSSWHRHHTYSPAPRTYRSLSPTDSRYNYSAERDLISRYDTETDFSPPPSPRELRRRGGGGGGGGGGYGSDREDNNTRHPYNNSKKSATGNKAPISSGSDKSYDSSSKKGNKSKSGGGGGGGGKFLV